MVRRNKSAAVDRAGFVAPLRAPQHCHPERSGGATDVQSKDPTTREEILRLRPLRGLRSG